MKADASAVPLSSNCSAKQRAIYLFIGALALMLGVAFLCNPGMLFRKAPVRSTISAEGAAVKAASQLAKQKQIAAALPSETCAHMLRENPYKSEVSFVAMEPSIYVLRKSMDGSFSSYRWIQDFFRNSALATPKSYLLDIGGNVGLTTLPVAALGYKVYAFEPIPTSAHKILTAACMNGIEDKVKVELAAVGAKDGTMDVFLPIFDDEGGIREDNTALSGDVAVKNVGGLTVALPTNIIKLDSWMETANVDPKHCLLVKVDVQGFELGVLQGAKQFLRENSNHVTVVAEQDPGLIETAGGHAEQVLIYMHELGYDAFNEDGSKIKPEDFAVTSRKSQDVTYRGRKQSL